jgi:hypothetical protein
VTQETKDFHKKTCFVSKLILFQKTLEYAKNIYYMQKNHLRKLRFQALFTALAIMGAMKKRVCTPSFYCSSTIGWGIFIKRLKLYMTKWL